MIETKSKATKVAVGMSGGVDSSLTAQLLVEQGYDVTGVFLECWRAPGCRSEEDRKDALQVALKLEIPFKVLDFKDAYKNKVVEYFFDEYEAGRTPNPDVMCNVEIKFGLFYDWALDQGFDFVATGHYAKTDHQQLLVPADTHKDQTYFLYRLTDNQLQHVMFPLGEMTKEEVRAEAAQRQLHVAAKKDSVGICFIGDINVHNFLYERLGENPGEVIDTQGNVIGEHRGLWFYTVGQRHGFDINKVTLITKSDGTVINKHNIPPFYVIKKLPKTNQLMVGFGAETYFEEFNVRDIHWISGHAPHSTKVLIRIRHTGKLIPGQLVTIEGESKVNLDEPTQGIAEGQSAVFYQQVNNQLVCLGGGVIR